MQLLASLIPTISILKQIFRTKHVTVKEVTGYHISNPHDDSNHQSQVSPGYIKMH